MKPDIVCIADIKLGTRHRKDMGDLDALASSLAELGMLQPVGITPDKTLVFGERRMSAAKLLGWTQVPALVFDSLTDAVAAIKAERDENRCWKEMTPSEYVELGRALEAIERAEAEKRMKSGAMVDPVDPSPQGSTGKTRDKVVEALGISGKTYERAKTVVEEAPELVEAMDSGALPVSTAAKVAKLPEKERKKVAKCPGLFCETRQISELSSTCRFATRRYA
jgi:ParB family chromosome partitioning protein